MAVLRVQVPTSEHPSGIVEYRGDVSGLVDAESQALYVLADSLILAEYPPDRYTAWDIAPDVPDSEA